MPLPQFKSVIPVFTVDDLPAALDFYQRVLGFSVAWTWGTPPDRASVQRDNVEITLSQRGVVDSHGPSRIFFQLSGIDDYYAEIQDAGAQIDVPLDDREYGMRDFHIVDPSGNKISFGQTTTD
jgi:predicted enzyme related to lactoylglutathione lyase